jgi:hypothetical protein
VTVAVDVAWDQAADVPKPKRTARLKTNSPGVKREKPIRCKLISPLLL